MHPVSVIIPHLNEPPERLAATVQSAIDAGAADIVVVDDGSDTPPTRTPLTRLVEQPHRGIAAALNLGFSHARQWAICWLSVGDTMCRDRLGQQLALNLPASFGAYVDGVSGSEVRPSADWCERLWYDNQFCGSTTLVNRAVIDAIGGWDESLNYMVDWMFALRIEQVVGWHFLDEILGTAAEHPGGHTDRGQTDPRRQLDRRAVVKWARANEGKR